MRAMIVAQTALIGATLLGGPAGAQSIPPTEPSQVPALGESRDPAAKTAVPEKIERASQSPTPLDRAAATQPASTYRLSRMLGASVVNGENKAIGRVDDFILTPNGTAGFAVISTGGFLGVGSRLVGIPYESLKVGDGTVSLPGASREGLETLPEFHYAQ